MFGKTHSEAIGTFSFLCGKIVLVASISIVDVELASLSASHSSFARLYFAKALSVSLQRPDVSE